MTQPVTPNNNTPAAQPANSLASRLTSRLNSNQPAGQPAPTASPPAPASTPAAAPAPAPSTTSSSSPFGSSSRPATPRPGAAPATSNPPTPPRFGSPFQNQKTWTMQPIQKTVVLFELKGLGDPFYRLLGRELNSEYGDFKEVTAALERGGEEVKLLEEKLNQTWESYHLQGAILVYNWHQEAWKTIATPPTPPAQADQEDSDLTSTPPVPPTIFSCLRAIDLNLVLNVLARSRSQVLLTRAPLVFSQQYLNRQVMSDDPRLVALAKATGYLDEETLR